MPAKKSDWEGKTLAEILAGVGPLENLVIAFDRAILNGGRPIIRLSARSVIEPRKRARSLCPMIVGDPGETHADMLEKITRALR